MDKLIKVMDGIYDDNLTIFFIECFVFFIIYEFY